MACRGVQDPLLRARSCPSAVQGRGSFSQNPRRGWGSKNRSPMCCGTPAHILLGEDPGVRDDCCLVSSAGAGRGAGDRNGRSPMRRGTLRADILAVILRHRSLIGSSGAGRAGCLAHIGVCMALRAVCPGCWSG